MKMIPPSIQIDSMYKHFDKMSFGVKKRMKLYPEPTDPIVKEKLSAISERLMMLQTLLIPEDKKKVS